jgi:hypothetical protein
MDNVVQLPGTQRSLSSRSRPAVLSAEDRNRISRDIRHLEALTARAKDTAAIAELIASAFEVDPIHCRMAAAAIPLYITTGRRRDQAGRIVR